MNERIKELADQALLPFKDENGFECYHFSKEKFAELIIQKCIDICLTNSVSKDEARWAAGVCAFDIQEHFGVD